MFAAYRGHKNVVRVLLQHGAVVGPNGGSPIHYAGQRKHKDIRRLLVQHGVVDDLLATKDQDLLNLFRAAYSYDAEAVKAILARRPELVDWQDKLGRTAMHEACTNGDTKTVRVLLKNNADPAIRGSNGQTPADRSAAHKQHRVVRLLDKHNDES